MSNASHQFHRWVNPAGRMAPAEHTIEATEPERASLAEWLAIPAVRRLAGILRLSRESADSVTVRGSFSAEVDLVCGVTLEVFTQPVGATVEAIFRKSAGQGPVPPEVEVDIDIDTEDPHPWVAQGIDLGGLLAEELSLALPDFPRRPGAELPAGKTAPDLGQPPNPFAVLARLPRKGD